MLSVFHASNLGIASWDGAARDRTRHKPALNAGMNVVAGIASKRMANWHGIRI